MAEDAPANSVKEQANTEAQFDQARAFLSKRGLLPSPECITERAHAFDQFCRLVLGKDVRHSLDGSIKAPDASQYSLEKGDDTKFVIVQVGSHGFGVWNQHDPLVCVCFGSANADDFSTFLDENIQLYQAEFAVANVTKTFDRETESLTLEGHVDDVFVKLEYCYLSSNLMAKWDEIPQAINQESIIPTTAAAPLNAFGDCRKIASSISNVDNFRLMYRLLEFWARSRGIYHRSLGYLERKLLIVLLYRFWKGNQHGNLPLRSILVEFFTHYSSIDWHKDAIADETDSKMAASFARLRTKQKPAVVLSLSPPFINVAAHVTEQTLRVILDELRRTKELLETCPMRWTAIFNVQDLEGTPHTPLANSAPFIQNFRLFVRFEFQYWGSELASKARFLDSMKNHYLAIVDRLSRTNFRRFITAKKNAVVFSWPYRLLDASAAKGEETYCYLIGINNGGDASGYQSFLTDLQDECAEISADFKRDPVFDPLTAFAKVSVVNRANIGELRTDPQEASIEMSTTRRIVSPEERKVLTETYVAPHDSAATKKLRSASEVLHRLIWDARFDRSDYTIGYLDRFSGVMEIPLDSWKVDSTAQDFIPQHRILYFKKKSDNQIMWDRRNRVDRIFDGDDVSTDAAGAPFYGLNDFVS